MVDERWGEEGVGCFFDEWIFNFLFFFLVSAAGALSGGEERGEWPRACLGGWETGEREAREERVRRTRKRRRSGGLAL